MRALVMLMVLGLALSSCGIWDTCEQKCYAQKSNEPRDFDDCIRRCQK